MIRYCLPMVKFDWNEIESAVADGMATYSCFELWVDYLHSPSEEQVCRLAERLQSRLLVLFRRQQLEAIRLPLEQRLNMLRRLSGSGAAVDLDQQSQQAEIECLRDEQIDLKVVLSYHNYSATPESAELREILEAMLAADASVCKLATFCRSERDALRLLELRLECSERGISSIILGMGRHGAATRIFGTLWGNELIFAPARLEECSAPGQLSQSQLREIFKVLDTRRSKN